MPFNVAMQKSPLGIQCRLVGNGFWFFSHCNYYLITFILIVKSGHFRFIPPEDFSITMLRLELEFVKKGARDEHVYYLLQAAFFIILFSRFCLLLHVTQSMRFFQHIYLIIMWLYTSTSIQWNVYILYQFHIALVHLINDIVLPIYT